MIFLNASNGCAPLEHPAVDEESRRAVDAGLVRPPAMSASTCVCVLVRVDAGVELGGVEAELRGVLLQVRRRSAAAGWRTACRGTARTCPVRSRTARFGRRPRVRVVRQRIVAVDEMDAIAVGVEHLLERRTDPLAERALEVGELDDFDRCVRRSPRRARSRAIATFWRGGSSMTRTCVLLFSVVDVLRRGPSASVPGQERADRLPHLFERRALHPRLVRLIPGRDLRVGDRRRLRRDFLFDQRGAVDALRLAPPRPSASRRRSRRARRAAPRRAPATASPPKLRRRLPRAPCRRPPPA